MMRFAFTRRSMSLAAMAAAVAVSSSSTFASPHACCDDKSNSTSVAPFDTKGFPMSYTPAKEFFKSPKPMILAGAGMRRKNLYIVEVDVYKTGFNLTSSALKRSKAAIASNASISTAIKASEVGGDFPECAIVLKFVRGVSAQQVVDAFDAAFVGCNPDNVNIFKTKLKDVIGDAGMKNDDEITFFWKADGGLLITRNGSSTGGTMQNSEIENRLLDVYIDPSRTVSKELVDCVHKNLPNAEF